MPIIPPKKRFVLKPPRPLNRKQESAESVINRQGEEIVRLQRLVKELQRQITDLTKTLEIRAARIDILTQRLQESQGIPFIERTFDEDSIPF